MDKADQRIDDIQKYLENSMEELNKKRVEG